MAKLTRYSEALAAGLLPKRDKPLRFAVGPPDGLTSNSWKVWNTKSGLYIACRDSFRETKVSLHTGGRWRIGFTEEALPAVEQFMSPNQNRAWDVWDEPPATLPEVVTAFRLVFQTSELAVTPEQRTNRIWKDNEMFIEAGAPGKLTVATLFVCANEVNLKHESEPTIALANYTLPDGGVAQLVAHGENEAGYQKSLRKGIDDTRAKMAELGKPIPPAAYAYFVGNEATGCRYIFGARVGER